MGELTQHCRTAVAVERAVFECRAGRAVEVFDAHSRLLAAPLQHDPEQQLAAWRPLVNGHVSLLLSGHRMAQLGGSRSATMIELPSSCSADDLADLAVGHPHRSAPRARMAGGIDVGDCSLARAAIRLACLAETIPALLVVRASNDGTPFKAPPDCLSVNAAAVEAHAFDLATRVSRVSQAPVPIPDNVDCRFVAYRTRLSSTEHIAVVQGTSAPGDAPLVRLHSACLTGDVFHSMRCDCGEQLSSTISRMAQAGGGIVCYLAQEGRGIGLSNKLKAYTLQDDGLDTLDANEALGFARDERLFNIAAGMLSDLGVARVRLMTNNPDKIAGLKSCGIEVVERVGLPSTVNRHNERYMTARAERSGYLFAPSR